ncbi:DUF6879 family protein [Streptomyces sp. NPDC048623]|uniref:DUF6879 family protein n=1 Tax=Streptomyces sp. NPDC048623 TaxID=3155761 RepID=UPI00342DF7FB
MPNYNADWLDEIRSYVASGRRMYRVHVLSRPLRCPAVRRSAVAPHERAPYAAGRRVLCSTT